MKIAICEREKNCNTMACTSETILENGVSVCKHDFHLTVAKECNPGHCKDKRVVEVSDMEKGFIGTATSQSTVCPICHGEGYSMQKVLVASIDFGLIEHEIKQFCDSCDGKGRL